MLQSQFLQRKNWLCVFLLPFLQRPLLQSNGAKVYSTVTDFARLRGLSTSQPLASAIS